MFRSIRNQKREIHAEEAIRILEKGEYGILSTTGENGYAYGIPLNYVYLEDGIYFHCALEGQKLDHIRYNSKVSFCVVGETAVLPDQFSTAYESVVVFGKAIEVGEPEKTQALQALIQKYAKDFAEQGETYIQKAKEKTAVVKIEADHITGKARIR